MAGEVPVSKQQWVRYLSRTRNTIALHCSVEGVVTEHNPSARRLFGWHDRLEGKPLAALLHRADHAPLSLAALPVDGDMMPLALVAEDSGKVLQGFFFREPDGVLLLADVIGDGDEVSEQLGVMANEISDISRDLRQRNRELEEANRRITELSRTDVLTGLANRRYFLERLNPTLSLAQRHGLPLALVMADLDHFKRVNDTHGHEAGDRVLRAFADTLRAQCRREDLPCRFGGEEFLILLPQTTAGDGVVLAERVRTVFAETAPPIQGSVCTASFGVAAIHSDDTPDRLIARADKALYAAKSQGRNRTAVA